MFDRLRYQTKVTQASSDFKAEIMLQTEDKHIADLELYDGPFNEIVINITVTIWKIGILPMIIVLGEIYYTKKHN